MDEKYYTPNEIADILKVSARSVRRWILDGKLLAQALPGRGRAGVEYRVSEADLTTFLRAHRTEQQEVTRETNQ
jgi:excisionase family DNA binding protein